MIRFFRSYAAVVVGLLLAGCASSPPRQTGFMEEVGVDMSKRELQLRVLALGDYMASEVERSADRIAEGNQDLNVVRKAMMWKINGVPRILSDSFISDPLAATVILWATAMQMTDLFTVGPSLDAFGDRQAIAVEASREMEARCKDMVAAVMPSGVDSAEVRLRKLAMENKFEGLDFGRVDHKSVLAAILDSEFAGGLAATGAMNEQMVVMADQMNAQGRYIPKQARWQTELSLARLPDLVEHERAKTLQALREEIYGGGTLNEFLTSQREAVFSDISEERLAVVEVLREERLAIVEMVVRERAAILEAIQRERLQTLQQLTEMSLELLDEGNNRAIQALDRTLLRAAALLALPFLAVLAVFIIALLYTRRHLRLREREMNLNYERSS